MKRKKQWNNKEMMMEELMQILFISVPHYWIDECEINKQTKTNMYLKSYLNKIEQKQLNLSLLKLNIGLFILDIFSHSIPLHSNLFWFCCSCCYYTLNGLAKFHGWLIKSMRLFIEWSKFNCLQVQRINEWIIEWRQRRMKQEKNE